MDLSKNSMRTMIYCVSDTDDDGSKISDMDSDHESN